MGKAKRRKQLGFSPKKSANASVLIFSNQDGDAEALGFHILGGRFIVQATEVLPGNSSESASIKEALTNRGITRKTLGVSAERFDALNVMPFVAVKKEDGEVALFGFFFTNSGFSKAVGLAKEYGSVDPGVLGWLTSKDAVYGCLSLCKVIHSLASPLQKESA